MIQLNMRQNSSALGIMCVQDEMIVRLFSTYFNFFLAERRSKYSLRFLFLIKTFTIDISCKIEDLLLCCQRQYYIVDLPPPPITFLLFLPDVCRRTHTSAIFSLDFTSTPG
jgi:hypothetical protein